MAFSDEISNKRNILITGANGYVGFELLKKAIDNRERFGNIVAMDIREFPVDRQFGNVEYVTEDIRSPKVAEIFTRYNINIVVHLAAIVSPGPEDTREFQYSVDVLGTENILKACCSAGVKKIILTSSGAAYGYHADSPERIKESDPLRGNPEFPYSDHKRQVEETLASYRQQHPQLQQLIFRPGTVLGANVNNQITNLFEQKVVFGLRGTSSPFVFIWDQDVVACLLKGILSNKTGIYNLAGDGTLSMKELAAMLQKPFLTLPVSIVKFGLTVLKKLRLTRYGPEQINFIRYRPVLSNQKLKEVFELSLIHI